MINKLKYYIQKCFEYAITHTFWYFITTVCGFIVLNAPRIFSFFTKENNMLYNISNICSVISLVIILLSLFIFALSKKYNGNSKEREDDAPEINESIDNEPKEVHTKEIEKDDALRNNLISQMHFKKVTISMRIESCANIEYTMKYDGYALEKGIETFEKQLAWSGTGYTKTILESKNIEAHIDDNIGARDHSPYTFCVLFDEDIDINDRIKFTTKTLLSDSTKCMMPLSSFCVKYPIDELTLSISAPVGLIHTIRKKCYKDASRQMQISSSKNLDQHEIEGYKEYSFTIHSPTPWLYYTLEWKFSEKY